MPAPIKPNINAGQWTYTHVGGRWHRLDLLERRELVVSHAAAWQISELLDLAAELRRELWEARRAIAEALEVMENSDAPSLVELPVATDRVAARYSHVHGILDAARGEA